MKNQNFYEITQSESTLWINKLYGIFKSEIIQILIIICIWFTTSIIHAFRNIHSQHLQNLHSLEGSWGILVGVQDFKNPPPSPFSKENPKFHNM